MENISNPQKESESTLIINLNEEYKIKIEEGNQFEKSIFKDVYISALNNVIEIVKQSDKRNGNDDFNNIIAFTGERGKGKSSSMISFRNALVNHHNKEHSNFFISKNEILQKKFATIDIVDPSLFRGGESLFEIILAQMFNKFQIEIKDESSKVTDDDRRSIIKLFQEVFENLQIINSDRTDLYKKESIEALSKLATSSNLRNCFKDLVSIYLEKFERCKDFLVIAIDDFDLNISGAYEMLEDIRQFLIQSNIILLIACKMEQLSEAINVTFNGNKPINNGDKKSEKYLEKIFPFKRRNILPDIQRFKNIDLVINKDSSLILELKSSDVADATKENIYKNFEIVLNKERILDVFSLDTIRGIQNFFNVSSDQKNYVSLKNYLLNEIEKNTLDISFFKAINEVKAEYLNLSIIKHLHTRYKLGEIRTLAFSKLPERISIGDVLYSINTLEKRLAFDDYEILNFIEVLKIFYILKIEEYLVIDRAVVFNFAKYGFINTDYKILAEDEGKSRDYIEFGDKEETVRSLNIKSLDNKNKFLLSQFMLILGNGKNYRIEVEKNNIIENYKKFIFSPFSLFHNFYNFDALAEIFTLDRDDIYIRRNLDWFENSKFIRQLFNPSFTLTYFEKLSSFRKIFIKEELPDNYFDTIILLFVYGSINSIENKELRNDFLKYPIISSLLQSFKSRNEKNFSVINKINAEHDLKFDEENAIISTQLVKIINEIFIKSIEEVEDSPVEIQILNKLKTLLKRIKNRPNYKIQTLSTIINEIKEIDEFNSEVSQLSTFKDGINSLDDDNVKQTKSELETYLIKRING